MYQDFTCAGLERQKKEVDSMQPSHLTVFYAVNDVPGYNKGERQ